MIKCYLWIKHASNVERVLLPKNAPANIAVLPAFMLLPKQKSKKYPVIFVEIYLQDMARQNIVVLLAVIKDCESGKKGLALFAAINLSVSRHPREPFVIHNAPESINVGDQLKNARFVINFLNPSEKQIIAV